MSLLGGGKASGSGSMPGRGLRNPAFIIKLVPATDTMQQKQDNGRDNPNTDYLDNLKTGSNVRAKVDGRIVSGAVQRIIKNELGDCTYVIVMDKKGKVHKIESTLVKNVGGSTLNTDDASLISTPVVESKFYTYAEFIKI